MPAEAPACAASLAGQRRMGLRVALAVAVGLTLAIASGAVIATMPAKGAQARGMPRQESLWLGAARAARREPPAPCGEEAEMRLAASAADALLGLPICAAVAGRRDARCEQHYKQMPIVTRKAARNSFDARTFNRNAGGIVY